MISALAAIVVLYVLLGAFWRGRSPAVASHGIQPVTLAEFHAVDLLIFVGGALFGACFCLLLLIAFFGEPILNLIFGG